jgi:hypothetical protein
MNAKQYHEGEEGNRFSMHGESRDLLTRSTLHDINRGSQRPRMRNPLLFVPLPHRSFRISCHGTNSGHRLSCLPHLLFFE